jgi:hypothetical protein
MSVAKQETDDYLLPLVEMAPELLGRMQHGLRALGAYPDGHPVCQRRLRELIEVLSAAIARVGDVEFRVIAQELAINDLPLSERTPGVEALLEAFRRCGVEAIGFGPEVEPDEVRQVLLALSLEPREVRDRGGLLGAAPHVAHLPHIRLECVRYVPASGGRAAREHWEGLAAVQTVLMQLCAREASFLSRRDFELIVQLLQEPPAAAQVVGAAMGDADERNEEDEGEEEEPDERDVDPIEVRRRARAIAAGLQRAAMQSAGYDWETLCTQAARCFAALPEDMRDEALRAATEEDGRDAEKLGAIWRSLPSGEAAGLVVSMADGGDAEKLSVALAALAGNSDRLEGILDAVRERAEEASLPEDAQGLLQDVAMQILAGLAASEGGLERLGAAMAGLGKASHLLGNVHTDAPRPRTPSSQLIADHACVLGELISSADAGRLITSDPHLADTLSITLADNIADMARAGNFHGIVGVANHIMTSAHKELARRVRTRLWERRDAMDALLRAFSSADAAQREELADILTLTGAAAVPGMLDAAVRGGASGVAGTVSRVIARMGSDGLRQVAQQVREGRPDEAAMGVETLARVGGEIAEEAVRHAVRRPEVQVRLAALEAAPHLSLPAGTSVALALTDDPEPTVSIGAITCLGELRDDGGVPRLANMALTRGRKANQERRRAAVSALGKIGSEAAMRALVQVIKSGCFFGRRGNDEIRLSAVRALADVGTEQAADALEAAASATGGRVAAAARKAAAQIRTPEAAGEADAEVTPAQQGADAP